MEWEPIHKRPEDYASANLQDYQAFAATFSWDHARSLLDGLPGGGLNIAHEALDRHAPRRPGKQARLALDRP